MRLMVPRNVVALITGGMLVAFSAHRALGHDRCFYRGTMYSEGANSCQGGHRFQCDDGKWHKRHGDCAPKEVRESRACVFDGISFSTGSASCQAGQQYRCESGEWASLGLPCSVGDAPIRIEPSGRACMYEGATVSNGATVCRTGSTFLCSDGQWMNLGTLCQ